MQSSVVKTIHEVVVAVQRSSVRKIREREGDFEEVNCGNYVELKRRVGHRGDCRIASNLLEVWCLESGSATNPLVIIILYSKPEGLNQQHDNSIGNRSQAKKQSIFKIIQFRKRRFHQKMDMKSNVRGQINSYHTLNTLLHTPFVDPVIC